MNIISYIFNKLIKKEEHTKQLDQYKLHTTRQNSTISNLREEIKWYKKEFKNLTNTNSKLMFDNFIKEMRDIDKISKTNRYFCYQNIYIQNLNNIIRMIRHRSLKSIDNETVKLSIQRWDSLSKMLEKMSKSWERKISYDAKQDTLSLKSKLNDKIKFYLNKFEF